MWLPGSLTNDVFYNSSYAYRMGGGTDLSGGELEDSLTKCCLEWNRMWEETEAVIPLSFMAC